MSTMRRTRWYPPPPPTPRILHLPRRPRRKTIKNVHIPGKLLSMKEMEARSRTQRGKLETLFDQERAFTHKVPIVIFNNGDCERRERVEEDFQFTEKNNNGREGGGGEEEKWKFQAEILRAECNFLRLEREVALRKLELNRVQTKKTLRSAVETLISGKKKIFEGRNVDLVLEEEIEELEEKVDELQRKSGATDIEVRKCSNFDKKASVLQSRLEKLGFQEKCVQQTQEIDDSNLSIHHETSNIIDSDPANRFTDVESLGRKMEGLSKGMLERMESEYRSMLTSSSASSATASANSSTSNSSRFEFPSSVHQNHRQERMFREEKPCSGRCKAIVRKIVEQVKAEMEQWSQMQEMLGRVREEMEELQASRDFSEGRALDSDDRVHSLQSAVQDWRQKAQTSETKVSELQKQVHDLHIELERLKTERNIGSSRAKGLASSPLMDLSSQKEKEKRVLIRSLKERRHAASSINKKINNENCKDDDDRIKGRACGRDRLTEPKQSPLRATEDLLSPVSRQLNNRRLVLPLDLKENCPVYSNNSNQMMNKEYYNNDADADGRRKGRGCHSNGRNADPNRSPLQAMENSSSPKPILRQLKNRGPMSPLSLKENNCQAYSNNNKQMKKEYNKDDNGRRKGSVIGSDGIICPKRSPLGATEISLPSMFRQHSNRGLVFPMH